MAKIRVNGYTREFQGRVGPHVFRRAADGTMIASIRPDFSGNEPTEAQKAVRADFSTAAKFAKRVTANATTRARYRALAEAQSRSAYSLAVRDWYVQPSVDDIQLTRYHGQTGDMIEIVASDDVGLTEVYVAIKDKTTQAIVEEGLTNNAGDNNWVYTATTTLAAGQAVVIEVTAKDGTEHSDTNTRNYP
jgi:hypothetical protein